MKTNAELTLEVTKLALVIISIAALQILTRSKQASSKKADWKVSDRHLYSLLTNPHQKSILWSEWNQWSLPQRASWLLASYQEKRFRPRDSRKLLEVTSLGSGEVRMVRWCVYAPPRAIWHTIICMLYSNLYCEPENSLHLLMIKALLSVVIRLTWPFRNVRDFRRLRFFLASPVRICMLQVWLPA
jgi:hypothetical protein